MTELHRYETPVGAEIVIDGKPYINFGGSSYLGLSGHPDITAAGIDALQRFGAGGLIARNHNVITDPHRNVDDVAAGFFGTDSAMLLSGGYLFGLAALTVLKDQFQAVFYDELSHFSVRDGIAASGLRAYPFRHLDAGDLAAQLKQHLRAGERPLVATDGMYSTFGEIAPLADLLAAAAPYQGRLLIDESHSFGVLGATGRGAYEQHGLSKDDAFIGGSLGKAFGVGGGIIPGAADEVDALRNSPVGRGASQGSAAAAAMAVQTLKHVAAHPEILQRLRANVAYAKRQLNALGLNLGDSIAPVAAFKVADPAGLKAKLLAAGVFVYHTTYIGAGAGGVIRCAIFADHTPAHIDRLVGALRENL